MDHFNQQLSHLVAMASEPGSKAYAWERAKELERCETGMWNGIADALKSHMLAQSKTGDQLKGRQ